MYNTALYNDYDYLYNGVTVTVFPPFAKGYVLEVRDASNDLVAFLENAFNITLEEEINKAPILSFDFPSTDSKVANLTRANEILLYKYGTATILGRFRLCIKDDKR